MKCKYMFRGHTLEVHQKKYTGKVGRIITIEGADFKVSNATVMREGRDGLQIVSLSRVAPDEDELRIVGQVMDRLRFDLRQWKSAHEKDTSGCGCNLPETVGRRKGREEMMNVINNFLDKIEESYRAGE